MRAGPAVRRLVTGMLVAAVLALLSPLAPVAGQEARQAASSGPRFEISFSRGARTEPVTGRVYVAISRDNRRTPIEQAVADRRRRCSRAYVEALAPGAPGHDRRHRPRASAREPARPAGRRVLGAAVRERLHEVRARRRQDGVAAHGPVGGTELEAIAGQPLRRPGQGHLSIPAIRATDHARRRQGDSADRAAARHRAWSSGSRSRARS